MFSPLLDVTSLTDRQTMAKWPVLWHLEHFFPLAGHVSSCLWMPLHLEHGWTDGEFYGLLSRTFWTGLLVKFGFPFFRCISPNCRVSDWPAIWDLTSSDWRAIWIAISRFKSDLICSFCESDLSRIPMTILFYLLISLCSKFAMFCQSVEISNKGLYCFSFFFNAAMKTCSLTNNILLRYKMVVKFLNNLIVFLLIAFSKCKRFEYMFCLIVYIRAVIWRISSSLFNFIAHLNRSKSCLHSGHPWGFARSSFSGGSSFSILLDWIYRPDRCHHITLTLRRRFL